MDQLVSVKAHLFNDPEVLRHVINERVAKGAALLDERVPDWASKISLEELDFNGIGRDIFQQVFETDDMNEAANALSINGDEVFFGFLPPGSVTLNDRAILKETWAREITARLQ